MDLGTTDNRRRWYTLRPLASYFEEEIAVQRFGGTDNAQDLRWRPRTNLKTVRPPEVIADNLCADLPTGTSGPTW